MLLSFLSRFQSWVKLTERTSLHRHDIAEIHRRLKAAEITAALAVLIRATAPPLDRALPSRAPVDARALVRRTNLNHPMSSALAAAAPAAAVAPRAAATSATRRASSVLRSSRKNAAMMPSSRSAPVARVSQETCNPAVCAPIAEDDKRALVDAVETFIFDCDGVIWKGDSLIEGVPETIAMLRDMGKRLIFVTNNSTKSRAGYLKKFLDLGLEITADEVFSSSFAAAAYLDSIDFPRDKKVYVVGETGILGASSSSHWPPYDRVGVVNADP